MKDNLRESLAYVIGCIVNKKDFSTITDHGKKKVSKLTGKFVQGNIDVLNQQDGSRLVGMVSGKDVSFFHSLENVSIMLKLNNKDFVGHVGESKKEFTGSVNGHVVKIYDGEEYNNFFYELAE
jgi:hypothetical protein